MLGGPGTTKRRRRGWPGSLLLSGRQGGGYAAGGDFGTYL
jgi:hypothetical protein